jgi:hypothetical protein
MSARPSWRPLAEVALFYGLIVAFIWGGRAARPTVGIGAALIIIFCVVSVVLHGDGLRRAGLAYDEFWPCAARVTAVTLPFLIPLAVVGWMHRATAPWDGPFAILGYPVWSFVQEFALMSFAANRLEDGLGARAALAPWINGLLFSFAHLPNPILMTATFVSGVIFTRIFLRHRHILPIAFAHAALGLSVSLAFSPINGSMSVGPAYLSRVGSPPQFKP